MSYIFKEGDKALLLVQHGDSVEVSTVMVEEVVPGTCWGHTGHAYVDGTSYCATTGAVYPDRTDDNCLRRLLPLDALMLTANNKALSTLVRPKHKPKAPPRGTKVLVWYEEGGTKRIRYSTGTLDECGELWTVDSGQHPDDLDTERKIQGKPPIDWDNPTYAYNSPYKFWEVI